MKNHITTIITAISSCLATLSFLAIYNPSTLLTDNTTLSTEVVTTADLSPIAVPGDPCYLEKIESLSMGSNAALEPFLGQIMIVGFNFAPRDWALCEGQLLPISSYTALFSLLGTTYGGDGRTTFRLPDLRGRVPLGVGTGTGLPPVTWGQNGGTVSSSTTQVAGPGRNGNITVVNGTDNRTPYTGVYYAIALNGTFPSRN